MFKGLLDHCDNNPLNGKKFGKLYNWYAVNDPRGISPNGWHVPSFAEYEKLIDRFGGYKVSGKLLKSNTGWDNNYKGENGNGNNISGFNGLPGGRRDGDGEFSLNDRHSYNGSTIISYESGYWWSNTRLVDIIINGQHCSVVGTELDNKFANPLHLTSGSSYGACSSPYEMYFGFSVRCIKDNSSTPLVK